MAVTRTVLIALVTGWFALVLPAADARAQYFGQNKVQYEDFDFRVLRTEHFDIYYYEREEEAIRLAARMAERWYARLSRILKHELSSRQPLIMYASAPHFQQTNVITGFIGEGTGGVTEALKRRVILPFAAGLKETDHVLGHELVHAFQYDILGRNAGALPLWFIEGMAEYLSLGPVNAQTAMWMRDAVLNERFPSLEDLDDPRYFPYRFGHALWAYLAGRFGEQMPGDALRASSAGNGAQRSSPGSAVDLIEALSGVDRETLSSEWLNATQRDMVEVVRSRQGGPFGQLVIGSRSDDPDERERDLNVGPALSPDGRRLAFLSARGRLSIDLYIADAQSGTIERRVTSTAADPHFDSLQFINSAGTWSPDGARLAFAALRRAQPVLVIVDAGNGDRVREIEMPGIDEVFHPAWSPDGRSIVLAGLSGGLSDLWLCDVESGKMDRLTQDAFADLHPAWAPDGRAIAFTSDRFDSNLEGLALGEYQIARMDLASRQIGRIATFPGVASSQPQWAPDGRSLYFLATAGGVPDVYRIDVGRGEPVAVTQVPTGVSGITPLSPAISVAAKTDAVAFVLYYGGGQTIRLAEGASPDQTAAAVTATPTRNADRLAPSQRSGDAVEAVLAEPSFGLPPPEATPQEDEPFKPKLTLDYVGQQFGGVGLGPLGARAVGGVSLLWSDMLGEHTVGTTLQINGSFRDIGAQVGYINRASRWNWGAFVEQFPYVTGTWGTGTAVIDGELAEVQQEVLYRQTDRQVSGMTAYPFSRAMRFEAAATLRRLSFEQEVTTRAISLETGDLILDEEQREDLFEPVSLAGGSAALVYDTSVSGATGPILGQRFRFEVTPTGGDLFFTGALADFRRYFMPVRPWTIATRVLHVGRYGRDAENNRLGALFLGYPTVMRGYDIGSLDASECPPTLNNRCPALDRLIGSRILVANVELRVPIVGAFTRDFDYGPIPVEAFAFADAGTAWTRDESPSFAGGDREVVRSVGAGVRVNALGFLILELDAVKPLDRPDRGWRFQFLINPAF